MNPIRSLGVCFLLSFCAVVPSGAALGQGAAAGKGLIGEWEGQMVDGDGSNPGQRRMNISLIITDTTITATGGRGETMGDGTYKVSGRHLDTTGTSGQYLGKKYLGLFAIEGDTLKWCSGNDRAKTRPAALKTNTKDGHFLMVLTRKK